MSSNFGNIIGDPGLQKYKSGTVYNNGNGQLHVEKDGIIYKLLNSPSTSTFVPGEWEAVTSIILPDAGVGIDALDLLINNTLSIPTEHSQHTDTGTTANSFLIGDAVDNNKIISLDLGLGNNNPKLRFNKDTSRWEYSNDNNSYIEVGEPTKKDLTFKFFIPPTVSLTGLKAYWNLDETSGNVIDQHGSFDGVPTGGFTRGVAGIINTAWNFNGSTGEVNFGNVQNFQNTWTIAAWVKLDTLVQLTEFTHILGKTQIDVNNRQPDFDYVNTSNTIRGLWRTSGTFVAVNFFTGETTTPWRHCVMTFDNGVVKSYGDGQLIETKTGQTSPPSSPNSFYIGSKGEGTFLNGSVDETGVWNRALNQDEITTLYNGGTGLTYPFNNDISQLTDQIFFLGRLSGITDFLSSELSGVTYESRVDSASTFTSHADLAALETWISTNIFTETLWWIKADVGYSSGETGNSFVLIRHTAIPVKAPTVQVTNLVFSAITDNAITVNFTDGNGESRLLLAKAHTAIDVIPADNITYSANTIFGQGAEVVSGSGVFVVADGSGPHIISGLSAFTTYHFQAFEYNGPPGAQDYITLSGTGNPASQTAAAYLNNDPLFSFASGVEAVSAETFIIGTSGITKWNAEQYNTNISYADQLDANAQAPLVSNTPLFDGARDHYVLENTFTTAYPILIVVVADSSTNIDEYISNTDTNNGRRFKDSLSGNLYFGRTNTTDMESSGNRDGTGRFVRAMYAESNGNSNNDFYELNNNNWLGLSKNDDISNKVLEIIGRQNHADSIEGNYRHLAVYQNFSFDKTEALATIRRIGGRYGYINSPLYQASAITISDINTTAMTVNYTNGDGENRLLVVESGTSAVVNDPTNGVTYTADTTIGLGSEIGTGSFVIGVGSGPFTVLGLSGGTDYAFKVFEFNGSGGTESYANETSSGNPASATTIGPPVFLNGGGDTASNGGATQVIVSGWSLQEDDVLVAFSRGGNIAVPITNFNLYKIISTQLSIYWQVVGPTPPTTVDTPGGQGAVEAVTLIVYAFRNANTNFPIIGNSQAPNETNCDPILLQRAFLSSAIIAGAGARKNGTAGSVSSGFDNLIKVQQVDTNQSRQLSNTRIFENDLSIIDPTDMVTSETNGWEVYTIEISQILVPPSTQVSGLTIDSVVDTAITISFSDGSGSDRILVAKSGSTVDANPVSGTPYTADGNFGSGSQIGTGNYVVGQGSGPLTVSGLTAGIEYFFAAFEFNATGSSSSYLTGITTANTISQVTYAYLGFSGLVFSFASGEESAFTLTGASKITQWSPEADNGTGYLLTQSAETSQATLDTGTTVPIFDGVGDYFILNNRWTGATGTLVVVAAQSTENDIFLADTVDIGGFVYRSVANGLQTFRSTDNALTNGGTVKDVNEEGIYIVSFDISVLDDDKLDFKTDFNAVVNNDATNHDSNLFAVDLVGWSTDVTIPGNCYHIMVYDTKLTNDQMDTIADELNIRYHLGLKDPAQIFGEKLQFWFDNTNTSNITFNSFSIASQLDESGKYLRNNTIPSTQPSWGSGVTIASRITSDILRLKTSGDTFPNDIVDDDQGFFFTIASQNEQSNLDAIVFATTDGVGPTLIGSFNIRGKDVDANRAIIIMSTSATTNTVRFPTGAELAVDEFGIVGFSSDSTRYKGYINSSIPQDPLSFLTGSDNGAWFDATAKSQANFYATIIGSSVYYSVSEKHSLYLSEEPTATELTELFDWGNRVKTLTITFNPPPLLQASGVTFNAVTETTMDVNFTDGDGSNRLLVVKSGSTVDANPVDSTVYTADPTFGSGTEIGAGNYVVAKGSGPHTISGLTSGITYNYAVFEYNDVSGEATANYLTGIVTGSTGNSASQIAIIQTPSQVLGSKLQFWFDNSNYNNITFSGSNVASQTGETGQYIRKQTDGSRQPAWASGITSPDSINDYLEIRTSGDSLPSDLMNDTQGFVMAIVAKDVGDAQGILSVTKTNNVNREVYQYITSAGNIASFQKNQDTDDNILGTGTTLTDGVYYAVAVSSNGSRYLYNVDGVEQTINIVGGADTGDWFGDITQSTLIMSTYANVRDTSPAYFGGNEKQVLYMSEEPTALELTDLFIWGDSVKNKIVDYSPLILPSIQASGVTFSGVTDDSMSVNFIDGDGSSRLLVVNSGGTVDSNPVDNTTYTASTVFGEGSEIGTGNYVVGVGSGPFAITGLTSSTSYGYAVFEFNGSAGSELYLTGITTGSTGNSASQTTLEAETIAFENQVIVSGGSLTATEKSAINQLVIDLKADSMWTGYLAIYPMVGATSGSCSINLKTPGTYDIDWVSTVAGDFTASGWTPNGSSSYGNTGLIPVSGFSGVNRFFLEYYSRTDTAQGTWEIGADDNISTTRTGLICEWSDGTTFFEGFSSSALARVNYNFAAASNAHYIGSRQAVPDAMAVWRNGTQDSDGSTNQTGSPATVPFFIGARNNNGTASGFSTKQCAGAGIGNVGLSVDSVDANNIYNAWTDFNTTLSRNN